MNQQIACGIMFIILCLLVCSLAFGQEVIPVPPVKEAQSLSELVNQAVFAAVSAFLLFVLNYAKDLINQYRKAKLHERGYAVVENAFWSALNETCCTRANVEMPENKSRFLENWLKISIARLDNLAGFKKPNIEAWVKEQQDIIYQKLINERER